jgi:transposase InsO family protein
VRPVPRHGGPAAAADRVSVPPVPGLRVGHRLDELLGRGFAPSTRLNTRWCGDITCLPTPRTDSSPATVIDIASRKVVGWVAADHLRASLVTGALTAVWKTRTEGGAAGSADEGRCPWRHGR